MGVGEAMATYRVSEETRNKLIEAAGELFAEHGKDAVSIRDITGKAGVKVNAVHYHFGSKDGLIEAVTERALSRWEEERLTKYYEENQHLFDTCDGKRQLVRDLIDILYDMLCPEDLPAWVNMYLLKMVTTPRGKERVGKIVYQPIRRIFADLFRRITGNEDEITAHCFCLHILSAAGVYAADLTGLTAFSPGEKINYSFYRRIQQLATQNALFDVGLIP